MELLRTSRVPMSEVRLAALRESLREASGEKSLVDAFVCSVSASPNLSMSLIAALVDIASSHQWDCLPGALNCPSLPATQGDGGICRPDDDSPPTFEEFRSMAALVFSTSRKAWRLPLSRRKGIETAILRASDREELRSLMMHALVAAEGQGDGTRARVDADFAAGRYYNLLLPDRFDCIERPPGGSPVGERVKMGTATGVEDSKNCLICMGTSRSEGCAEKLPCGHTFCQSCAYDWAKKHGNPFPCPVCRALCMADFLHGFRTWQVGGERSHPAGGNSGRAGTDRVRTTNELSGKWTSAA